MHNEIIMLMKKVIKENKLILGKNLSRLELRKSEVSSKVLLSGLNIDLINQIENGQANPTLKELVKISLIADVNLPSLFSV